MVESYAYDAYGRILSVKDGSGNPQVSSLGAPVSALGNRYTYQGREIDWATGLMYFRARWYNPETGRWLSKDPIRIAGGLNLYAFCDNNPVNFVDPFGHCSNKVAGAMGLAAAADLIRVGVTIMIGGGLPGIIGGGLIAGAGVVLGAGSLSVMNDGAFGDGSVSSSNESTSSDDMGTFQDVVDEFNYYNSGSEESIDAFYDAVGGRGWF